MIEIREVIERGKAVGYGEKFIRELRENVFQSASWEKGSRHIVGLKWK
jgi:hypothetical protein